MRIAIVLVALVSLAGCTAEVETENRTFASPIEAELDPAPSAAPNCMTCTDALSGDTGAFCDSSEAPQKALTLCAEERCTDPCDDNFWRTLADPSNADACDACLASKCGAALNACEAHVKPTPTPVCFTCRDQMTSIYFLDVCNDSRSATAALRECLVGKCGNGACDNDSYYLDTESSCLDCAADQCGALMNACAAD